MNNISSKPQNTLFTLDPVLLFLHLILKGLLASELKPHERAFVGDNINKHRKILWINIAVAVVVFYGLRATPTDAVSAVITSLIAPVMVLGAAWFAVSFGGTPQKLLHIAMRTTFWMFTAFSVSLSTMFVSVGFVVSPIFWPVLVLIYTGALISCIQYDTVDGLKVGLDESVLKHSRAALRYYEKQGISPPDDL